MKEIKAYIQRDCVNEVVDRLNAAGAPGITIVEIHPVGYGYEPNYFEARFEDAYKRYAYLRIVKLEVVCADRDVCRLVQAIRSACRTGSKGDGWIFVTEVEMGIRIRDGASGEEALAQEREEPSVSA
jgi:nitrogen regulatory protein PII